MRQKSCLHFITTHTFFFPKSSKCLNDFATNLKTVLDSVLPSSDIFYEKISFIAFHYANDDMSVNTLKSQSLVNFRDIYNFDIEMDVIPIAFSHVSLSS